MKTIFIRAAVVAALAVTTGCSTAASAPAAPAPAAAAAMTIVSLGTGGKNPSMMHTAKMAT